MDEDELKSITGFSQFEQSMGTDAYDAMVKFHQAGATHAKAHAEQVTAITNAIRVLTFMVFMFGMAAGLALVIGLWKWAV